MHCSRYEILKFSGTPTQTQNHPPPPTSKFILFYFFHLLFLSNCFSKLFRSTHSPMVYLRSNNCCSILLDAHGIDGGFVSATCWIQGVYVYKELINKFDVIAYYGMPKNMDNDGMLKGTSELCSTQPKLDAEPPADCIPMTKTFFLQVGSIPSLSGFTKRLLA